MSYNFEFIHALYMWSKVGVRISVNNLYKLEKENMNMLDCFVPIHYILVEL